MNVSSIGLGKLGLCSAACFASKGHHVIGVDSNQRHVDALAGGECPIDETDLPALLARPGITWNSRPISPMLCGTAISL